MNALCLAGLAEQSLELSQWIKSFAFCLPSIERMRETGLSHEFTGENHIKKLSWCQWLAGTRDGFFWYPGPTSLPLLSLLPRRFAFRGRASNGRYSVRASIYMNLASHGFSWRIPLFLRSARECKDTMNGCYGVLFGAVLRKRSHFQICYCKNSKRIINVFRDKFLSTHRICSH